MFSRMFSKMRVPILAVLVAVFAIGVFTPSLAFG